MGDGYGIRRQGKTVFVTNRARYAHAVQFSEESLAITRGALTARDLIYRAERELVRKVARQAYNDAIRKYRY